MKLYLMKKSTMPTTGEIQLPNLVGSKKIILKGDTRLIERRYGIPMSKAMRRSDRFVAYYSADNPKKLEKYNM